MNRRLFLRNAAILAAGAVAADQLDLLDRIGWQRTLFPGADFGRKVLPPGEYIAQVLSVDLETSGRIVMTMQYGSAQRGSSRLFRPMEGPEIVRTEVVMIHDAHLPSVGDLIRTSLSQKRKLG